MKCNCFFHNKNDFKNDYNNVADDDDGNSFDLSYSKNIIYNDSNKFVVSCWEIDSYFNLEQIQMGDIEIMISACGLSGSFGYIVRSKSIRHNTYTVRRINFSSQPTLIHGPVHTSDLNHSYPRSHYSRLIQAVSKKKYRLSQKVSYASKIIDPVINGFSPNGVSIHLHISDHSIVKF